METYKIRIYDTNISVYRYRDIYSQYHIIYLYFSCFIKDVMDLLKRNLDQEDLSINPGRAYFIYLEVAYTNCKESILTQKWEMVTGREGEGGWGRERFERK